MGMVHAEIQDRCEIEHVGLPPGLIYSRWISPAVSAVAPAAPRRPAPAPRAGAAAARRQSRAEASGAIVGVSEEPMAAGIACQHLSYRLSPRSDQPRSPSGNRTYNAGLPTSTYTPKFWS